MLIVVTVFLRVTVIVYLPSVKSVSSDMFEVLKSRVSDGAVRSTTMLSGFVMEYSNVNDL